MDVEVEVEVPPPACVDVVELVVDEDVEVPVDVLVDDVDEVCCGLVEACPFWAATPHPLDMAATSTAPAINWAKRDLRRLLVAYCALFGNVKTPS